MATAAIYSLLSVLWWNLVGQWMYFVYSRGWSTFYTYMFLPRFDPGPPQWWLDSWHVYAWWNDNLVERRPNTAFVLFYRRAAKDRFQDWVEDAADRIATPLVAVISSLLGLLRHGYTTFSTWIEVIWDRVGPYTPWWATHLANAVTKLYHWIPLAIRQATQTWNDLWEEIKAAAATAAATLYDAARTWVVNNASWVMDWLNFLSGWYYATGEWLTNFRNNPLITITGILGLAWSVWAGIYDSILDFYNTVWVPYRITLHDFCADPLGWTYDRVEDELLRRW